MDEEILGLTTETVPGISLPEADTVWRIVPVTERDRKNKAIPAVRCFQLKPSDANMLSVDWSRKTTPEECLARVGATHKTKATTQAPDEYKDWAKFEIFPLSVQFVKDLGLVNDVVYDPIYSRPKQAGRPDNPAHSLIVIDGSCSDEDDPMLAKEMRDHASENSSTAFNTSKVEALIAAYRGQF